MPLEPVPSIEQATQMYNQQQSFDKKFVNVMASLLEQAYQEMKIHKQYISSICTSSCQEYKDCTMIITPFTFASARLGV